jgi:hypothetical protein
MPALLDANVICADLEGGAADAIRCGTRAQGSSADAAGCDAAKAVDVAAFASGVTQQFPRRDVIETTPRLNIRKPILDDTEADLDRVIAGETIPAPFSPQI